MPLSVSDRSDNPDLGAVSPIHVASLILLNSIPPNASGCQGESSMASKEPKGWVWTDEEKASTKSWKRRLRTNHDKIAEQLRRFQHSLPALADEAGEAARPVLERARPLLDLVGAIERRRYQGLSPQEVEADLAEVSKGLALWNAFLSRMDVQVAIQAANRRERLARQSAQRATDQAIHQALQHLETPEYAATLDANLKLLMDYTTGVARMTRSLPSSSPAYGDREDEPYLQRLLLIYFVGYACVDDRARIRELREFVAATPSPSFREVLRKALYLLDRASATSSPLLPSNSASLFSLALNSATEGFRSRVEEWRKNELVPRHFGPEHFQLFGISYSLDAHPD